MRLSVAVLLLLAACRTKSPSTADAGSRVEAGAPADAGSRVEAGATADASAAVVPKLLPLSLYETVLLPNGHVLASVGGGVLWDWDAITPGASPMELEVSSVETSSPVEVFLGPGTSFVVQHHPSETKFSIDLWDGSTRTKQKTLAWNGKGPQTWHSFSEDGSRFLYQGCNTDPKAKENLICEVVVYALPSGKPVGRVTLPSIWTAAYFPIASLSKDGRYFDVSVPTLPGIVYEVASGKLVFPTNGELPSTTYDSVKVLAIHGTYAFIGEARRLSKVDLATGRELAHVDLPLPKDVSIYRSAVSPDGRWVAFSAGVQPRMAVGVWTVGGAVARRPIPPSACDSCVPRWGSRTELFVGELSDSDRPEEVSFDVDPDAERERGNEDLPSFAEGGYEVTVARRSGDASPAVDLVRTPSGKRLELPHVQKHGPPRVVNDRLLLWGPTRVHVVQRDGRASELHFAGRY